MEKLTDLQRLEVKEIANEVGEVLIRKLDARIDERFKVFQDTVTLSLRNEFQDVADVRIDHKFKNYLTLFGDALGGCDVLNLNDRNELSQTIQFVRSLKNNKDDLEEAMKMGRNFIEDKQAVRSKVREKAIDYVIMALVFLILYYLASN